MNLILKRAGAFHAQWESLDGVCGTAGDSTRNYTYECVIVADAAVLDANGFIIDQLDVDAYFQNQYSGFKSDSSKPTTNYNGYNTKYASKPILYKPLSCERIAIGAVNDILKLVKNHGCKVSRLSVSIALASSQVASQVASMTCEWAEEKLEETPAKELVYGVFYDDFNGNKHRSKYTRLSGIFKSAAAANEAIRTALERNEVADNLYHVIPL